MKNRILKIFNDDSTRWPGMYDCEFLEQGVVNYKDLKLGIGYLPKPTIDEMLNSFIGKPVVIYHQNVTAENCKDHAVGYVTKVYFNSVTGKYHAQFLITEPTAHDVIENGFEHKGKRLPASVSCAYTIQNTGDGGSWHAMPYDFEIKSGTFTHMAIVPNPRYEDSFIQPITMLINSKGEAFLVGDKTNKEESKMKFKWFGKKEEKERTIENTLIDVAGKKVPVKDLINAHKQTLEATQHEEVGELGEESEVEMTNAAGDKIKVKVSDLVNSYKKVNKIEVQNCSCGAEKDEKHAKECALHNAESEEETDEEKEKRLKKEKEGDKDKDKAENARILAKAEELANAKIEELKQKAAAAGDKAGLKFFNAVSQARFTDVENGVDAGTTASNSREDQLKRGNDMFGPVKKD